MAAAKAQNYLSECLGKPSSLKIFSPEAQTQSPINMNALREISLSAKTRF